MSENKKFDKNPSLLARSAAGDKKATEELVRYNAGLVTSIAARFIGRGGRIPAPIHSLKN